MTTSDVRGAGTDADMSIVLYGQAGAYTAETKLDSSKDDFERGRKDKFVLNLGQVGVLYYSTTVLLKLLNLRPSGSGGRA